MGTVVVKHISSDSIPGHGRHGIFGVKTWLSTLEIGESC